MTLVRNVFALKRILHFGTLIAIASSVDINWLNNMKINFMIR